MPFLKIFKFIIFIIFFFFFSYSFFIVFAQSSNFNDTFLVYIYNYDRYNYNYVKFIRFYYFDYYTLNFNNFWDLQNYNYGLLKHSFTFYFYKYFYMIEDSVLNKNLEVFNFLYFNTSNKSKNSFSVIQDYNYSWDVVFLNSYLRNFLIFKEKTIFNNLQLSFLLNKDSHAFGELFFFNYISIINLLNLYFLNLVYIFFIFVFFVFFFFVLVYYLFSYIFFYKKFYIIGQFFTLYSLDTEDNHGGYLDYMEEQELDISFADNYYNIVKYEFNYLNYILFLNKYLLNWLCVSNFFFLSTLNLGQFKNIRFSFFSEIFYRVEINFLAGLTMEDDFGEWAYFPYEHVVEAFPESNFYVGDAVFEYAKTDLAFDFSTVRRLIYKDYLHPLNLFQEDTDDELEYEEFFEDIEGFLKNYNYSSKILTTYKKRFKNIYICLLKKNNLIENSFLYSGSFNTFMEVNNRIFPVNFEGFFMDWPFFREIINNYNILNNNYEESNEEDSFQEINIKDRERERILKREEEDLQVIEKNKIYLGKVGKKEEEDFDILFNNLDSFKESLDYFPYNKIKKDIWRTYSISNFFSIILESSLLQWIFRSNWLWSKYKVPLEYTTFSEENSFFETDIRFKIFFNSFYRFSNFGEDLFLKKGNLSTITNQLVNSYVSLESLNLKLPPYKNYIGYILLNPFLRNNRDLYMLELFFSRNLQKLIYKETAKISSFDFLIYNTYIFDVMGLPSGMVLSTNNVVEESLYSNNYIKEIEQVEVLEEEDVDFSFSKPLLYNIFRFVSFNFLLPFSLFSFYGFLVVKNIF